MSMYNQSREELMDFFLKKKGKGKLHYYIKIIMWNAVIGFTTALKRVVDIIGSAVGMVLFSPLYFFTMVAIYINDPGPIFYSQIRVGKNGKHFRFFKFRSMLMNADKMKDTLLEQNESSAGVIFKMKKDPRITKVGRIIRKLSIDELPQLYNVLRGDMSLVGPRPALPREVAEYTLEQRKRLHVIPGITGIWQVSGRSDISFEGQMDLDLQYIRSTSVWKDIVIILKTIPAVISGKGAY